MAMALASAARAQEGDDLAGDLDAAAAELTGVAHAVGDVAVELAVLIYNGVDAPMALEAGLTSSR